MQCTRCYLKREPIKSWFDFLIVCYFAPRRSMTCNWTVNTKPSAITMDVTWMVGIYSWIKRATERSKKKKKIKKSIPQIMLWTYYCILLLTSHLISSHHSHNKSLFCYAIRNGDGVDRNKLTFGNFVWVLEEGLKICAILRNNICYGWLTMSNVEFDRLLVLYGTYPAGRGGQQEEISNPECIWALFSMCQGASFEY